MEFVDDKLALFFDKALLQETVDACVDKGIHLAEVRWFTQPENRIMLAKQMLSGQYHIAPPHIIQIPKPGSNETRKVYCNEPMDRFICAQIGRVYERMFHDRIHPNCVSYQKGIGVGRIVREIAQFLARHPGMKGAKFAIHHYFDEVSEATRDKALKELGTGSCIDRVVWEYLHDDAVIDEHDELHHVYKGIAQGFALSPFLANYILRDVDEAISRLNVLYYRYSDDILILGEDFEQARDILYAKLAEKGLTINPKKVTAIDADTPFTFLGFKIHGDRITFSEDSVNRLKKNIRSLTKTRKGQPLKDETVLRKVIRQINHALYVAYLQNDREFGWAEYMFGTVNVLEDIEVLDRYIKDHLRHVYTGKWNSRSNYRKVPNDMLRRCGYVSMAHLFKLYRIAKPLYRNEVRMKCAWPRRGAMAVCPQNQSSRRLRILPFDLSSSIRLLWPHIQDPEFPGLHRKPIEVQRRAGTPPSYAPRYRDAMLHPHNSGSRLSIRRNIGSRSRLCIANVVKTCTARERHGNYQNKKKACK